MAYDEAIRFHNLHHYFAIVGFVEIHASYMTIPFGYYFKGPNEVIGISEIEELRDAVDFHIHVWLIISHKTDIDHERLIKKEMDRTYLLEREIEYVGINYYVLNK